MNPFNLVVSAFERFGHRRTAILLSCLILISGMIFSLYFRSAYKDEVIYLQEASEMSILLRSGKWIGNYGVGLHGFLFKLPVAIIFIITGPSILVATMFTVLLSSLTCYLFYIIQSKYLRFGWWSIAGCLFLITSHQFILNTLTFLRDIPALFSVVLLIYSVLSKKNKFIIGLCLLFLLDAKEHIFFTVGPAVFFQIILEVCSDSGLIIFSKIRIIIKNIILAYSPSMIFIGLMFYTGLVPVNMYTMYILGSTETKYTISQIAPEEFDQNDNNNSFGISFVRQFYNPIKESKQQLINTQLRNKIDYIVKFFSPRTFGFLSMPFTLVLPSLVASFYLFSFWLRKKSLHLLIISLTMWSHYVYYLLKFSHGRYLLPVFPSIIIFFIMFLKEDLFKLNKIKILFVTGFLLLINLTFEINYVPQKILLYLISFGAVVLFIYKKRTQTINILAYSLILVASICLSLLAPAMAYLNSPEQRGQVYYSKLLGLNSEVSDFYHLINYDGNIWLNDKDIANLINFYTNLNQLDPEQNWALNSKVPKKYILNAPKPDKLFVFEWSGKEEFRRLIKTNDIKKLIIIHSEGETSYKFYREDFVNSIDNYFNLNESVSWRRLFLKNKSINNIDIKS